MKQVYQFSFNFCVLNRNEFLSSHLKIKPNLLFRVKLTIDHKVIFVLAKAAFALLIWGHLMVLAECLLNLMSFYDKNDKIGQKTTFVCLLICLRYCCPSAFSVCISVLICLPCIHFLCLALFATCQYYHPPCSCSPPLSLPLSCQSFWKWSSFIWQPLGQLSAPSVCLLRGLPAARYYLLQFQCFSHSWSRTFSIFGS